MIATYAQADLFSPRPIASPIASPTPAATTPAVKRREHCSTQAPGPRRTITGDLPTLVVDGIKHLTYFVE